MRLERSVLLSTTIIAGLAVMAVPSIAMAQDAPPAPPPPPPEKAKADKAAEVEEVVVTGSRIKRSEFNSPNPIQVLTSEASQLAGVSDTASMLQGSTLATGSPQITSTISTAFVTAGGPGAQTLSLRGLGANRTVVLLNGRRAGPAGVRGQVSSVDLNVIPESIIDRVEILKDGASSVYGSDAIAGVVNIITKKNLDGGSFDAFASQPEQRGGEQYKLDFTWGKTFARGYFSFTVDYSKTKELTRGDRSYLGCAAQYQTDATTHQRSDLIDPRQPGTPKCNNLIYDDIWLYTGGGGTYRGKLQFDYGHNLGAFVPRQFSPIGHVEGTRTRFYPNSPTGWYIVGADLQADNPNSTGVIDTLSPFNAQATVTPELTTKSFFAQGGYNLGGSMEAYTEVLLNRRENVSHGYRQFWTYLYTAEQDPFSAGFTNTDPRFFDTILSPTPITNHNNSDTRVDFGRVVGGLRGDIEGVPFLKGWSWDAFVQYSHSSGLYGNDRILDDAVKSAEGRSMFGTAGIFNDNSLPRAGASCVGMMLPKSHKPCIDINWLTPDFMAGIYTPAESAFLFDHEVGKTVYEQTTFEASATGDLFNLPAGPVGAAVGVHMQKDSIDDVPGPITLAGNIWGQSGAGITRGSDTTKEAFGELSIPIFKGVPFAEKVDLSLSGRYTNVSSYGSNNTYKVGLNWQIVPQLRVRGTYGTSFRAPALFELFLADQTSFLGQRSIDPCINWAQNLANNALAVRIANNCQAQGIPGDYSGAGASATIHNGGGAGVLKAETSKAKTLGVIWTPRFADLSIAVDYFDIQVDNEVTTFGPGNIVTQCYNSPTFPTDPLCGLFHRNAAFLITDVRDVYINIANQIDRGLDLTARYRRDFDFGRLSVNLQATWTLKNATAIFSGNSVDNNGSVGNPDFTSVINTRFDHGDWTGFWSVDVIGKASQSDFLANGDLNSTKTTRFKVRTEPVIYHTLSLRKHFDTWDLLVGVRNVFDEHPPAISPAAVGAFGDSVAASQYDYVGRRAFINISHRF